ncbi:preprotein translocase subunit SecG [Alphaproteobacteria bacterium HT1-32]|nr:preprotein translocase subunit SecG [Alphaproteobacteria bacterium HT1-32]
MVAVLLAVHLLLAIFLIAVVLMQRSEGGALGMGGGGGGGLMTSRGAGNLLTRSTAILAACFMATSLALAVFGESDRNAGALQSIPTPAVEQPAEPAVPAAPTSD